VNEELFKYVRRQKMNDGRNYIPYPFYWDDVPIDISFVFEKEAI